jgi:putative addiction module component (TIGR02574 family)
MTRTLDEIRDEALGLGVEERGWLAEALWDSLRTPEQREIDAAWESEIDRRVAEVEAGTAKLIPGEEVLRELRTKRAVPRRRSR